MDLSSTLISELERDCSEEANISSCSASSKAIETQDLTNKPLSLDDLPYDLAIPILCLAGSQSQATYRTLLLTSKAINEIVRLRCIPVLPIVISKKSQLGPFFNWLKDGVHSVRVRYLWMVLDASRTVSLLPSQILGLCPNLVSLACSAPELMVWDHARRHGDFPLANLSCLRHLTVLENSSWRLDPDCPILSQIESLHVIGCREPRYPFPCTASLNMTLPTLTDLSFSVPNDVYPNIADLAWRRLFQSPRLRRVAFVTHSKTAHNYLETIFRTSLIRFNLSTDGSPSRYDSQLLFRPRRLTEVKLWKEKNMDPGCVWKLRRYADLVGS